MCKTHPITDSKPVHSSGRNIYNSRNEKYLSSLYCLFICPAWVTAYHGLISLHFYTDLLWYSVKLWPLLIQRVVIVRFVTVDQKVIEKSKISCNKGFYAFTLLSLGVS